MGKNSNAQYRYIGYKYNFPNDVWLDMRYGYNDLGMQLRNEDGDIRHNYSTRKVELGKNIMILIIHSLMLIPI